MNKIIFKEKPVSTSIRPLDANLQGWNPLLVTQTKKKISEMINKREIRQRRIFF